MRRYLALALILLLLIPVAAESTGTLTIPVVFGNLAAGVQNLSLFDTAFNAIATYINAREVAFGLLTARPVAGVAGRYYFATDTSQYFADNGTSWVQVGGAAVTGTYAVRGLVGSNNAALPLSRFDMAADQVALRNPTDQSITVRTNTGTLTNDTLLAGAAANGRDVAAAFTTNTWIHFYFIWNGTTLATLSSATAPPTGPVLPATYTSWAYAGFVRFGTGAGGSLLATTWRGNTMFYNVATTVVSNGTAIIETPVSVASAVAPNAAAWGGWVEIRDAAAGVPPLFLRVVSGSDFIPKLSNTAGGTLISAFQLQFPNINQQFFFQWASAPSIGATVSVSNAVMPNGGP